MCYFQKINSVENLISSPKLKRNSISDHHFLLQKCNSIQHSVTIEVNVMVQGKYLSLLFWIDILLWRKSGWIMFPAAHFFLPQHFVPSNIFCFQIIHIFEANRADRFQYFIVALRWCWSDDYQDDRDEDDDDAAAVWQISALQPCENDKWCTKVTAWCLEGGSRAGTWNSSAYFGESFVRRVGEINTNDGRDVNCCVIVLTHRNVICARDLGWRNVFPVFRHFAALRDDFSVCPFKSNIYLSWLLKTILFFIFLFHLNICDCLHYKLIKM